MPFPTPPPHLAQPYKMVTLCHAALGASFVHVWFSVMPANPCVCIYLVHGKTCNGFQQNWFYKRSSYKVLLPTKYGTSVFYITWVLILLILLVSVPVPFLASSMVNWYQVALGTCSLILSHLRTQIVKFLFCFLRHCIFLGWKLFCQYF